MPQRPMLPRRPVKVDERDSAIAWERLAPPATDPVMDETTLKRRIVPDTEAQFYDPSKNAWLEGRGDLRVFHELLAPVDQPSPRQMEAFRRKYRLKGP